MNNFQLIIFAYNNILYNGSAVYCGITTEDGSIGLEAGHEPLLSVLKENSFVNYKDAVGIEKSLQVENGILSFNKNKCTITVSVREGNR